MDPTFEAIDAGALHVFATLDRLFRKLGAPPAHTDVVGK